MPGYLKDSNSWKQLTNTYAKVGGSWKQGQQAWVKVGGSWKQWFSSGTVSYTHLTLPTKRIV